MIKKLGIKYTYIMAIALIFTIIIGQNSHAQLLMTGMSGSEVFELQTDLNKIGYMSIEPTGYFGEITKEALKNFQRYNGLRSDGIAGDKTFKKISEIYRWASRPLLKKGMTGIEVLELQKELKTLGYFTYEPTNYFGDVTQAAVMEFQRNNGLIVDGDAGINTYKKIHFLLNKPALKKGISGPEVSFLQENLKLLGYFNEESTGYFGEITEASLIAFQQNNNLTPSGIADLPTNVKINCELNKLNIIVIDAGHGGVDPGTLRGNVLEKTLNLQMSLMLEKFLQNSGNDYRIVLTRRTDSALDSLSDEEDLRYRRDLKARVDIIKNSQSKLFVSIHVNSYPQYPSESGSIVFYNDKVSGAKTLALYIQKELNGIVINGKKRAANNVKVGDFYILNNNDIPGVLVETAFITNDYEYKLLQTESFKEEIARAVAIGIEKAGF